MRTFNLPIRAKQFGLSLIELMVAMLLSLLLLAGVVAIFASSRKTYETTDQLSRLQENGRFALDVITHDLRSGGYAGCKRSLEMNSSLATTPAILWNFEVPIEGFDAQGAGWAPALDTTTILDADPAGDAIAIRLPRADFEPIRMTAPLMTGTAPIQVDPVALDAVDLEAGDVVQITDCKARSFVQVTGVGAGELLHAKVPGDGDSPGNSSDVVGGVPFEIQGEVVPMSSVVYFLRVPVGRDVPSLYRRVAAAGQAEELVEGIESMQFQFGEDIDDDDQIRVDDYRNADEVSDWNRVLSVRVALLVRSMTEYGSDRDESPHQVLDVEVPAQNDRRLRQVFSTTVTLRNAAI